MKRLLFILLFISQVSFAQQIDAASSTMMPSVVNMVNQVIDTINQKDFNAYMRFWADEADVAMIDPVTFELLVGKDAILADISAIDRTRRMEFSASDINIERTSGEYAWLSAKLISKIYDNQGRVLRSLTRPIILKLKRVGPRWYISLALLTFDFQLRTS